MGVRAGLTGVLAAAAIALTGCASTEASSAPPAAPSASGMSMSADEMAAMTSTRGPSASARMICGAETRGDVARILAVSDVPRPTSRWAKPNYTCTYRLPAGPLVLSVHDAASEDSGRRYFDSLQRAEAAGEPILGALNFGLPATESTNGTVAFLKDGKTLTVDASRLPQRAGPDNQSRGDVAYAVAAAVVACWSE